MKQINVQKLASVGLIAVIAPLASAQPVALDTFGPGDSFAPEVHAVRGPNSTAGNPVATGHMFTAAEGGTLAQIRTAFRHDAGDNNYTFQIRSGNANGVSFVLEEWTNVQGGDASDPFITLQGNGFTILDAGQTYWLTVIGQGSATGGWHRNDQSITGFWATSSNQGFQFFLVNGTLLPAARVTLEGAPTCPADLNGDGVVDADDFFLFLQWFADADPRADINNDGVIDADDFFEYLGLFAAGC